MVRVLFVCLGNICRSPMAEAVFQQKVREAELEDKIESDSAGTGHWHVGETPHSGTRRILTKYNIAYSGKARQIARADLNAFDYIITMDDTNYEDVKAMGGGKAKLARFLDYAPETGVREVPDPYYTGGFEGVYQLVDTAAAGLLNVIRQEHDL